jgi:transposase
LQSDVVIRDKSFQVIDAVAEPLEVSPGAPRRRWSAAARDRILAEAMAPGANVSAVARAHGLKPQQLFGWRRQAMSGAAAPSSEPKSSVMASTEASPPEAAAPTPSMGFADVALLDGEAAAAIEVVVGDVTIRVGPVVPMARL